MRKIFEKLTEPVAVKTNTAICTTHKDVIAGTITIRIVNALSKVILLDNYYRYHHHYHYRQCEWAYKCFILCCCWNYFQIGSTACHTGPNDLNFIDTFPHGIPDSLGTVLRQVFESCYICF